MAGPRTAFATATPAARVCGHLARAIPTGGSPLRELALCGPAGAEPQPAAGGRPQNNGPRACRRAMSDHLRATCRVAAACAAATAEVPPAG